MSQCDELLALLMEAVKKSSEALYAVKNGEQEPFDEEPVSIPMIGY